DGRELFRLQQVALALEQAGAHAVEGARQFAHFVAATRVQRMVKVSTFQGSYSGHQTAQRTRERVRNEEYQSTAHQDCGQTKQQEVAIQPVEELRSLIVRTKHAQPNRRASRAGQLEGSSQKAFLTD